MTVAPASPRIDQLPLRPLVTIRPDASLRAAARLMRAEDVSALVVGVPGRPVAVLTERDLTAAMAVGTDPVTPVAAATADDPVTVDRHASVVSASAAMLRLGVRHLVVVDGSRAVGMVSMRDALSALLRVLTPRPVAARLRSEEPDLPELWLG